MRIHFSDDSGTLGICVKILWGACVNVVLLATYPLLVHSTQAGITQFKVKAKFSVFEYCAMAV